MNTGHLGALGPCTGLHTDHPPLETPQAPVWRWPPGGGPQARGLLPGSCDSWDTDRTLCAAPHCALLWRGRVDEPEARVQARRGQNAARNLFSLESEHCHLQ